MDLDIEMDDAVDMAPPIPEAYTTDIIAEEEQVCFLIEFTPRVASAHQTDSRNLARLRNLISTTTSRTNKL